MKLSAYEEAAKTACGVKSFEEAHNLYPDVPLFDLPYLCMDLVYVYSVLVDGFGEYTRSGRTSIVCLWFYYCKFLFHNFYCNCFLS
jgi:hypothetical protein